MISDDTLSFNAAIKNNDVAELNRVLANPDIGSNNTRLQGALIEAVQHGSVNVVNRLLELTGIQDGIVSSMNSYTLLHALKLAIENGNVTIVNILLRIPLAQQLVQDLDEHTLHAALKWAIEADRTAIVNNALGIKLLIFIAGDGVLLVLNKLLEQPYIQENIHFNNYEALRIAALCGLTDVVSRFLDEPQIIQNRQWLIDNLLLQSQANIAPEFVTRIVYIVAKKLWPAGLATIPAELKLQLQPLLRDVVVDNKQRVTIAYAYKTHSYFVAKTHGHNKPLGKLAAFLGVDIGGAARRGAMRGASLNPQNTFKNFMPFYGLQAQQMAVEEVVSKLQITETAKPSSTARKRVRFAVEG